MPFEGLLRAPPAGGPRIGELGDQTAAGGPVHLGRHRVLLDRGKPGHNVLVCCRSAGGQRFPPRGRPVPSASRVSGRPGSSRDHHDWAPRLLLGKCRTQARCSGREVALPPPLPAGKGTKRGFLTLHNRSFGHLQSFQEEGGGRRTRKRGENIPWAYCSRRNLYT